MMAFGLSHQIQTSNKDRTLEPEMDSLCLMLCVLYFEREQFFPEMLFQTEIITVVSNTPQ